MKETEDIKMIIVCSLIGRWTAVTHWERDDREKGRLGREHAFSLGVLDWTRSRRFGDIGIPVAHTHLLGGSFGFTSVPYSLVLWYKAHSQNPQHWQQACQEGKIADPTPDLLNPSLHFTQLPGNFHAHQVREELLEYLKTEIRSS